MCLRAQALDDDDDDDGDGDGDDEDGDESPRCFSIIPQVPLYIRTSMKKSTTVRP